MERGALQEVRLLKRLFATAMLVAVLFAAIDHVVGWYGLALPFVWPLWVEGR
jgi:hypothetical protein